MLTLLQEILEYVEMQHDLLKELYFVNSEYRDKYKRMREKITSVITELLKLQVVDNLQKNELLIPKYTISLNLAQNDVKVGEDGFSIKKGRLNDESEIEVKNIDNETEFPDETKYKVTETDTETVFSDEYCVKVMKTDNANEFTDRAEIKNTQEVTDKASVKNTTKAIRPDSPFIFDLEMFSEDEDEVINEKKRKDSDDEYDPNIEYSDNESDHILPSDAEEEIKPKFLIDDTKLTCVICGQRFKRRLELKQHLDEVHKDARPYQCDSCGKEFKKKFHLKCHQRRCGMTERPYKCDCGKAYKLNIELLQHQKTHLPDNPFKCGICDANLASAKSLKRHTMIHENKNPYQCTTCGKKFNQQINLNQHEKTHSSLKQYKCEICGKKFKQRAGLAGHRKYCQNKKQNELS